MRKLYVILLALLFIILCAVSLAENNETRINEVLNMAGIQNPIQLSQWGDTAACFAEKDDIKHLIVLEKRNNGWEIVIDNPNALIQGFELPDLLLDSDNAIFWTYLLSDAELVRYHSTRNNDGTWGPVDQYQSESKSGESSAEWSTFWDEAHGGEIIRTFALINENYGHGIHRMQFFPATWMAECIDLAHFDISRFPTMISGTIDNYASEHDLFFQEAATAIMPDYSFIKGMIKNDALHFLMEKPDGTRVYVICEYASRREVHLIESTPLPAGTMLGYENFTDSLWIDERCVTIHLLYNGNAGIEYIYDDTARSEESEGFLFFGDRTIWDGTGIPAQIILYGDHPWDDITQIDWNTLPHNLDEASAHVDSSNYAMVINPNSADRLHLREQADKGSRSQGKYYTGTPVTIGIEGNDWAEVAFGDRRTWSQGYMMKRFLKFGQADSALRLDMTAMPQLFSQDNEMLKVYDEAQTNSFCTYHSSADSCTMNVIGIIGDEWYHVWFPSSGEYGFVRQVDLFPGNG